jgi:hypothetical protein
LFKIPPIISVRVSPFLTFQHKLSVLAPKLLGIDNLTRGRLYAGNELSWTITPIFGTSVPPSGISGMIRAAAFKTTENDIRHWLLLMLADRVNVVEGIVDDLSRGRVPNVLGEMGIKAEWQHNPAGLVKKAAIASALVGAAWYLMHRPKER